MFRVSCIQLCSNDNVEHNLKRTKQLIIKAVKQKSNFILTPEVSSKMSLNKKKLLSKDEPKKLFQWKVWFARFVRATIILPAFPIQV